MEQLDQPIHVSKPKRVRHLGPVDVDAIVARLERLSNTAWASEDVVKPNDFQCFRGTTQHIILRFPNGREDVRQYADRPGWHIWKDLLHPLMEDVSKAYEFRKPVYSKAMFARLAAGKSIAPHIDLAEINRRCHKIHVPLITSSDARLFIEGDEFHLPLGEAYEVNNVVSHWVANDGDQDRIHFIFEVSEGAQTS